MNRALDLAISVPALVAAAPVIGALALAVKASSRGPAFFRQQRIGRGRELFTVVKLRTMVDGADKQGAHVTGADDARITGVGRLLRATKLDELPQLWNVVRGDMSVVGPRPEAPRYLPHYRAEWSRIWDVRPGLTDLATVVFRDEESLLAASASRERAYVEAVLPAKVPLAVEGVERSTVLYDLGIIARTVAAILRRHGKDHPALQQARRRIRELENH